VKRALAVVVAAACSSSKPPQPQPPAWQKGLPPSNVMGSWRGLQPARSIVHLHSPYSHDACDNMPRNPLPLGVPNEPCLTDLRTALCTDQIDIAALTDHDDTMSDEDFPTLFNMRGSDQAVMDPVTGDQIASRITCDDGHVVTVMVGGENALMPVMLHHHVPGTIMQRQAVYTAYDATSVQAFRDAGGLGWIAHTEQHPIADLRMLLPDGIEVYNLHANIDPKIRGPYLNLDPAGAIDAVAQFVDSSAGHPEPDLALLSFLEVNQPAVTAWNQVLGDGRHVPATAGTDAHENAIPIQLADGERGDSYRRMMRWFANILLVQDPTSPTQIEAALGAGQMFVAFELLGTPQGLDIHAQTPNGQTVELGGTAPVGSTLVVDVPAVLGLDPKLPAPAIHATVLQVDATGAHTVMTGDGPELDVPMSAGGAYRVEITMVPNHLGPYLGDLGPAFAQAELPWIYASPIYAQ
jgi:hypothetical protein